MGREQNVAKKKTNKKTTKKKAVKKKTSKKANLKKIKKAATKKKKIAKKVATKAKNTTVKKKSSKKVKTKSTRKTSQTPQTKTGKVTENESEKLKKSLKKAKQDKITNELLEPGIITSSQIRSVERLIRQDRPWQDFQKYLTNPIKYNMVQQYQEKMVIDHKTMGIGFIVSVENNRMKVLFSEGMKNLIMNYSK